MIKNVIFDLDGTIINSKEGIVNAYKYALDYFNIEVKDLRELEKFIGPPLNDVFSNKFKLDEEQTKKAIEKYREYYKEKGIFQNELYNGIKELIIELKRANKKVIIATSKLLVFTERILENHRIKEYFDYISGSTLDLNRTKKEDIIEYAIKNMEDINISECIMIGDRAEDIKGAKINNMKSIGVTYGFGTLEELKESGADYIAENIEELKKILID